jgi:hypothetical protein
MPAGAPVALRVRVDMAMGSFEGEIGDAALQRVADVEQPRPRPPIRRIEDFAIDNMKSIAVGASAGVILLAAAVMLQSGPSVPAQKVASDPVAVGSITREVRVPALPEWEAIRKPVEMMTLHAPQFERTPPHYGARRTSRGEREDSLTWQPPSPGGPEARIALVRSPSPASPPSLFVDMTRQQAERGIAVTRAGIAGLLVTKFGTVEVADMTFSDAAGGAQACLAFRGAQEGNAPVVTGWYCAAQGATVDRPELACFIDRLSLLKSGEDRALRHFFTEAEQRRRPCPNARTTAGRKPTWLDHDGRAPSIRGADETTGSINRPRR